MTDMAKLIGALSDQADAPKMLVNTFPGKWVMGNENSILGCETVLLMLSTNVWEKHIVSPFFGSKQGCNRTVASKVEHLSVLFSLKLFSFNSTLKTKLEQFSETSTIFNTRNQGPEYDIMNDRVGDK